MFEDVRLGKAEYKFDPRTLKLNRFMAPTIHFQPRYDFDSGRAPFPLSMWGNNVWGNCVKCGEANQILRLERKETKKTPKISEWDVVQDYKVESARQFGTSPVHPGDSADSGLVMLDNMRNWRKFGFQGGSPQRNYTIFAFGEIDADDTDEIRAGIYNFTGVQLGFWLPAAAQTMGTYWDYKGETGPEWQPGSWGGHAVYSKAYTPDVFRILTWGEEVRITNSFVKKYCDEAWACVDSYDAWRGKSTRNFDVEALVKSLREVASNIEA